MNPARFDESGDWKRIAAAHRDEWRNWVKAKLDKVDFRDLG